MLYIDNNVYNIPINKLTRKTEFLDKYAERTESGDLKRELIGVYFNYELELGTSLNTNEYARLWDKLTEPVEFHTVTVPYSSGNLSFTAYFSSISDAILAQSANSIFTGTTVHFIAKSPARR